MLPQRNRLKNKTDFATVSSKGIFHSVGVFSLKYAANGLDKTRIGLPISKKVSPHAVDRNRLRRRLRATLAPRIPAIRQGVDIVIFPQKNALALDSPSIEREVFRLLTKSNLI